MNIKHKYCMFKDIYRVERHTQLADRGHTVEDIADLHYKTANKHSL